MLPPLRASSGGFLRPAAAAATAFARPSIAAAWSRRDDAGSLEGTLKDGMRWLHGWDVSRSYGGGRSNSSRSSSGSGSFGGVIDSPTASSSSSSDAGDTSSSSSTAQQQQQRGVDPEKAARVRRAFLDGSLAFGFSAGGLMFPYYVGVVAALEDAGVLRRPHQLAGASAGSLVAAAYNAGLSAAALEESLVLFGEDCLKNGTRARLGPLLRDFLHAYLPQDAAERCSGTTHVAVTRALPYWRPELVTHFKGRDDLVEALLTSCHIPWYFDGRWMTKFRGRWAVDGGATNFVSCWLAAALGPRGCLRRLREV